jgi:hypothetical protein
MGAVVKVHEEGTSGRRESAKEGEEVEEDDDEEGE